MTSISYFRALNGRLSDQDVTTFRSSLLFTADEYRQPARRCVLERPLPTADSELESRDGIPT